jgi:alpha-ribazole phosphatase
MEVFLIRHTTPAIGKGVCYGQSDIPLAESFLEEAAKLRLHLPETFNRIYSSPLKRCMELASLLSHRTEVITDPRLMELNFGEWEKKRWDDISGEALDTWMKDFVNVPAPGGENFEMVFLRTQAFYEELTQRKEKQVAIVCHAGVIRAFLAIVLEIPLRNAFKIPVSYASVTKLNLNTDTCYCSLEYLNKSGG